MMNLAGPEIAAMRWDHLDPDGTLRVPKTYNGLGFMARPVVHPAVTEILAGFDRRGPWVLPGPGRTGHVRPETLWDWVREVTAAAGLEGVTTDCLRRSTVNDSGAGRIAGTVRRLQLRRRAADPAPAWAERVAVVRRAMVRQELSPRTVEGYIGRIVSAERWCAAHGYDLAHLGEDELAAYVTANPDSHATRRYMRSALGHYWRILGRTDPPLWVIRVPRKPRMICKALEEADAARLAAVARARGDREGAAVLLGLHLALRAHEIGRVRWDDFDDRGWLRVKGKGNLPATLPVHPAVREALAKLTPVSPWVFPSQRRRGEPVGPGSVYYFVRKVATEAGVEASPHLLRHTALAQALDCTGDLRAVQDFARHSDPSTTSGYTRTSAARLVAVMEAVSYGNELAEAMGRRSYRSGALCIDVNENEEDQSYCGATDSTFVETTGPRRG